MALSNINIIRQNGGLNRPQTSNDGISGLLFFGESYDANVKVGNYKITDPSQASTVLGITGDTLTPSKGGIVKYHIDEYFRFSNSPLYVSIAASGTTDFSEIQKLQDFAEGELRQVGVLDYGVSYASSALTTIQGVVDDMEDVYQPLVALYSSEVSDVDSLSSIRTNDAYSVSVLIGEDHTVGSVPYDLTTNSGATLVGSVGTALGAVSFSNVHEDIGWTSKFNLTETFYQTPGFVDGTLNKDKDQILLNTLDTQGYVFLRKFVGIAGTYFNYGTTAALANSDFATIENNRVYNKAFRLIRSALLPAINSPLYVNEDGQLSLGTIAYFRKLAESGLKQMADNREISSFLVSIPADQNVLSTSKIEVTAKIVPVGVAKEIEVKLGFTVSV